ncbi:MAG: hypothetical protein IID34_04965 [Planctomycetes bacterium]|nr:hypothetical protein [Planctomycetota bacterium]
MSDPIPTERRAVVDKVDIRDVPEWKEPLRITFDQRASFQIVRWVLVIFAGVYVLSFGLAFYLMTLEGATFEKSVHLVEYMVGAILPLVTLAVGYYLGDKTSG